eukprot:scaffold99400_cov55-Phaeocystis_antarctica.AAC.3
MDQHSKEPTPMHPLSRCHGAVPSEPRALRDGRRLRDLHRLGALGQLPSAEESPARDVAGQLVTTEELIHLLERPPLGLGHRVPGGPRYAVRTARPRLVRVRCTYSAWGLRASCPMPLVRQHAGGCYA